MRNCGEQTHELDVYRLKLWLDVAERRVTVVVDGEAFVQPDVVPPEARDDVAEPLQQTPKLWNLCDGLKMCRLAITSAIDEAPADVCARW